MNAKAITSLLGLLAGMMLVMPLLAAGETDSPTEKESAPSCHNVERVVWMLGRWRQDTQGTSFFEAWQRHDDGTLRGRAESRKSDGSEQFPQETMIISVRDGVLVYAADPGSDGDFVDFVLKTCGEASAVFENPDHDFPQRLSYRLDKEGRLHASVTDLKDTGFDLVFEPDPR